MGALDGVGRMEVGVDMMINLHYMYYIQKKIEKYTKIKKGEKDVVSEM